MFDLLVCSLDFWYSDTVVKLTFSIRLLVAVVKRLEFSVHPSLMALPSNIL